MWSLVLAAAAAAPLTVDDATDAWYAGATGRDAEAAAWYLAHRDDDPSSARWLYDWLLELGTLPDQRHAALPELVERWSEAHPRAEDVAIAAAAADAADALAPGDWSSMFPARGHWCEPAARALSVRPEDPVARYRILFVAVQVASACGEDTTALERERDELALSGAAGPFPKAWIGTREGHVDEDAVATVRDALDDEDPERAAWLARLAAPVAPDEDPGPGRDAVHALLVERARAFAKEDRPSRLWIAAAVFTAAGLKDEEIAVRTRLSELDPGNQANPVLLERARSATPSHAADREGKEEPVEATTVLDPAERLRSLMEQGPPDRQAGSWTRYGYWSALADAARAQDDRERELGALRHLPPDRTRERILLAALATGRTGLAGRAARHLVASTADAPDWSPGADAGWRTERARALDLHAAVMEARGRSWPAIDDLEEALALAPPSTDRVLRLGLLEAGEQRWSPGAELLGTALLDVPKEDPRRADALATLDTCLQHLSGWTPDRESWLTAMARRATARAPAHPAPEAAGEDERFADLRLWVDGQDTRLFDLQGPLVLDVWATWCGPCMQSLPHLDGLAREYEGRVTFVAASVDEDREVAERYLARRGGATFRHGWLGKDGMSEVGVDGIPAMFVFDAGHHLVATLQGYGPGSTSLDEAVEAALSR